MKVFNNVDRFPVQIFFIALRMSDRENLYFRGIRQVIAYLFSTHEHD